jgi:GT2 family glycosyltransferase
MVSQRRLDELLVVIVLFGQKLDESPAYRSIQALFSNSLRQPEIFVYDNSLQRCETGLAVTYVHDHLNSGVSKAYNQAAMLAAKRNRIWLLLLDQDTSVTMDLFSEWGRSLDRHPDSVAFVPVMTDALGTVSPFYFARGRGRRLRVLQEKFFLKKHRFINTGLFIQRAAFMAAGGYDEDLPLDFSDISFGRRLMKVADHFIVMNTSLRHAFSATTKLSLTDSLTRFRFFCSGAVVMGEKSGMPYAYYLRALMRALHLSLQYRSTSFIQIFFEYSKNG